MLALVAPVGAIWAIVQWLQPRLVPVLGQEWAWWVAGLLSAAVAALLLAASYQAIARRSRLLRPERFDLRVRQRDDLLGRDDDVADLRSLLQESNLVFLDGESGSGKSAVVAHGLVPALAEDGTFLPALITDYSGDWDTGLARKAYHALWTALGSDDRSRLEVASRPPVGSVDAAAVGDLLERIAARLGRIPLLILDQFDDYQLAHRQRFLDRHREWIPARRLIARNRFWQMVEAARRGGKAHVLIVTRSDASAGLHSVRLAEGKVSRTLLRLQPEWLPRLLDQTTRDDGKGAVIAHPDSGWTDLQRLLQRDLRRSGAVLPQQVRIAFLGLRKLSALTPRRYRRAGGASGVEALYIHDSLVSAAGASGATELQVRNLLLELVERGPDDAAKTRRRPDADLAAAVPDPALRARVLERLERDEIVRGAAGAADGMADWQLDHDYLARGVLAEERAANRLAALLRDGAEAWEQAGTDWRQRIRSLLPLRTQLALAWAWLRSRGRPVYRPYRSYAAISTLRLLPWLLGVALLGWGGMEWGLRSQAQQIVDNLNQERELGGGAVLRLWTASPAIRSRAVDILLSSPGRLRDAGTDWVNGYISLESDAAADLVQRLRNRLDRPGLDPLTQRYLLAALRTAAGRLKDSDVKAVASDLRGRLDRPGLDPLTQRYLLAALGTAAGRLKDSDAKEVASDLVSRLDRPGLDFDTQRYLIAALGTAAGRLKDSDAKAVASDLRGRLDRPGLDPDTRQSLIAALGTAVGRLEDSDAKVVASDLVSRLDRLGLDPATEQSLIAALGTAAGRLEDSYAKAVASDLVSRLDRPGLDPATEQSLIAALGTAAGRLEDSDAKAVASDLVSRLDWPGLDPSTQRYLITALGTAAGRLKDSDAKEVASDLRDRLDRPGLDPITRQSLIAALGTAAGRLEDSDAKAVASDLVSRLDRPGLDLDTRQSLIAALGTAAGRLKDSDAKEVASDLVSRLDRLGFDPASQQSFIAALGTVAGRLKDSDAKAVVSDLVSRLDRLGFDPNTQGYLIDALGRAAGRLKDSDAKEVVSDLVSQLDRLGFDPATQQSFIAALGTAAGRLKDSDAKEVASDLRGRLDRPGLDPVTQGYLIDALATTSGVTGPDARSVKDLIVSVGFPLRDPRDESPAWPILDRLAGTGFEHDIVAMLAWADKAYGLRPKDARPLPDH